MRAHAAALTLVSVLAIAGSSQSAPPEVRDHRHGACTGPACKVSPFEGKLPAQFELAKMQKLGCDAPFFHAGGLREGETSWVGFSCPAAAVHEQKLPSLPEGFSDACLPKRHGRVYVPLYEAKCSLEPLPGGDKGPIAEKAKKLGCGPVLRYFGGGGAGWLGGLGTYCPDDKAVRDAAGMGFVGPYCDGCLKVPAGQIFVIWESFVGPNCPSGCPISPSPTQI